MLTRLRHSPGAVDKSVSIIRLFIQLTLANLTGRLAKVHEIRLEIFLGLLEQNCTHIHRQNCIVTLSNMGKKQIAAATRPIVSQQVRLLGWLAAVQMGEKSCGCPRIIRMVRAILFLCRLPYFCIIFLRCMRVGAWVSAMFSGPIFP